MNTRCIAEKIPGGRGDGLDHLGGEGGRSVVVEVDTHGERFILTFPLSVGKKRTRQAFYRVLYLLRLESEAQQAYTLTPPRKQDRRRFTCGNGMNRSARRADSQRRLQRLRHRRRRGHLLLARKRARTGRGTT